MVNIGIRRRKFYSSKFSWNWFASKNDYGILRISALGITSWLSNCNIAYDPGTKNTRFCAVVFRELKIMSAIHCIRCCIYSGKNDVLKSKTANANATWYINSGHSTNHELLLVASQLRSRIECLLATVIIDLFQIFAPKFYCTRELQQWCYDGILFVITQMKTKSSCICRVRQRFIHKFSNFVTVAFIWGLNENC